MTDALRIRLMLVDASENNRYLLRLMLPESLPSCVDVDEAASAQELLAKVDGCRHVVVVLDLDLPDKDGYQAINQLLAMEGVHQVSFLLLGPHLADRRMRLHRALHETVDYLPKPLEPVQFQEKVSGLLRLVRHSVAIESIHASDKTLSETMQEGLIGISSEGLVVYANQSALGLLKVSPGRLFKTHVTALLEEAVTSVADEWAAHPLQVAVLRDTIIQIQKTRLWRGDGGSLMVSCAVVPLRDEHGLRMLLAFRALESESDAREKLSRLTHMDAMTGLPTRVRFEEALAGAIEISATEELVFSVFLVDVDHFNYINESLGYEMGDRLVMAVSERLRNSEVKGLLARISGDKFALLAERVHDDRRAALVGHQLKSLFRQPFLIDGHEIFCSVSIGIALYPSCGNSASSLLSSADAALSRAKQLGRNNVQFYTTTMNRQTIERLELESDLHRALGRRELTLQVSPVLQSASLQMAFEESQLAWRRADGILDAYALWGLAEETGLLVELGEWLLEKSCRQLERMRNQRERTCPRIVRLSVPHLINPYFVLKLKGLVALYGLRPEELVFAVAESALLREAGLAQERLEMLSRLGFRLLLDGFGTADGSLMLLHEGPWKYVRLATEFAGRLHQPRDARLLEHLVQLVHGLGFEIVADGVASDEQLGFLRGIHCDYLQGDLALQRVHGIV